MKYAPVLLLLFLPLCALTKDTNSVDIGDYTCAQHNEIRLLDPTVAGGSVRKALWTQSPMEPTLFLGNTNTLKTTLTAPLVQKDIVFTITLTVTFDTGDVVSESFKILIYPPSDIYCD